MRKYEEQLKIARETGKGVAIRFQENTNYILTTEYNCPHCGAKHGEHPRFSETNEGRNIVIDRYETPRDIEFMCNRVGYSWTENCKCGNCGEMYSQNNGC